MATKAEGELTERQVERRGRVIKAALDLADEGGYDSVQIREVAARAGVALGTVYNYFQSKDHLLAAALLDWSRQLEHATHIHPAVAETTADRVIATLRRGYQRMASAPSVSAAIMTGFTSPGAEVAAVQEASNDAMTNILATAFPAGFDAATRIRISRTLMHVWYSALIGWVNGWRTIDEVGVLLDDAAHLLLDQYD